MWIVKSYDKLVKANKGQKWHLILLKDFWYYFDLVKIIHVSRTKDLRFCVYLTNFFFIDDLFTAEWNAFIIVHQVRNVSVSVKFLLSRFQYVSNEP